MPHSASLLLIIDLIFLILLALFIFLVKYRELYQLYISILSTGASFSSPSALQFHCEEASSFTILSTEGYNALSVASSSLPQNISTLVCKTHSLLILAQYYVNLKLGLLLLLPLHYLLVFYELCKSKSRMCIKWQLHSVWVDILLFYSTLSYFFISYSLFEKYSLLLNHKDISSYLSFISELRDSRVLYYLGIIFLLLLFRLLHRFRSTPLCGQFCFTLSALLRRAFILFIFYLIFVTLACLFLWLLLPQLNNGDMYQSLSACIHILLLKGFESLSSNSIVELSILSSFKFLSLVFFPGLLFALFVNSLPSALLKGKLHYRQHIIELQSLHLSNHGFLSSVDFPLSILNYFYFIPKCSKRATQRLVYCFSLFILSASLLIINILLIPPAYLAILALKLCSFCRNNHSQKHPHFTQRVNTSTIPSLSCKNKLCNFIVFLLLGVLLLLLRSFKKFSHLIRQSSNLSHQKDKHKESQRLEVQRRWLQKLFELIERLVLNQSRKQRSLPFNSLNYLSLEDGKIKQLQVLSLEQIRDNWKYEPDPLKIEREEAELIIRADTSFSNSEDGIEEGNSKTTDARAAVVALSSLLTGYEAQDLINGRKKVPAEQLVTLIKGYLKMHDLHQRFRKILKEEGTRRVWLRHSWKKRQWAQSEGYDGIVVEQKNETTDEVHEEEEDKGNHQSEASESVETRHTEEYRETQGEESFFIQRFRGFIKARKDKSYKIELEGVVILGLKQRREAALELSGRDEEVLQEMRQE